MNYIVDITFIIAVVAFVRARAPKLKGDAVLGVAFAIALIAAFLPDVASLFPQYQWIVEKAITIVKLFLSAPGIWDAAAALGSKIKNAPVG